MSYQLESSRFQEVFESAYRGYKTLTGVTLGTHPFIQQLEYRDSAKSITAFLQGHVPSFRDSCRIDRMMRSTKSIVYDICILSTTAAFGDAIGLVRQVLIGCYKLSDTVIVLILQTLLPGKAILTGLAILLTVCVFVIS